MCALRPWMNRAVAALVLAVSSGLATAQEQFGIVTAVRSGDRVVLSTAERTVDVVLAQIRAPSLNEALGLDSQLSLAEICFRKAATLIETGTAPDGSTIGKLSCGGVSAQEAQVIRGLARLKPSSDEIDSALQNAQSAARRAQVGIWNDASAASR
jgi:micrococcal nuclease